MVDGGKKNSGKRIDNVFDMGQQSTYTSYIIYDQVHVLSYNAQLYKIVTKPCAPKKRGLILSVGRFIAHVFLKNEHQ